MTELDEQDRPGGRALNRVLRELPTRPAPATLAPRVFAELQRRAALPWWRLGFTHWPPAARGAFLAACCILVACTLAGIPWASSALPGVHRLGALLPSWMEPASAAMSCAGAAADLLLREIPPLLGYGILVAAAALYALLFALGAAAYSTLYRDSGGAGPPR